MICSQLNKNHLSTLSTAFHETHGKQVVKTAFHTFHGFPVERWKARQSRLLVELGKTFHAFHGKWRGTSRETCMKYELSTFHAFHPLRGYPYVESWDTSQGFPPDYGQGNPALLVIKK